MPPNYISMGDYPCCEPPTPTTSPLFCDTSADVTFQSSDDILFKIHSKHLASTSAGFEPPSESTYIEAPVVFQENSHVLELLFQFVHPPTEEQNFRHPSVTNLEINLLFDLAEAAEKYIVFGAMTACGTRIHCEAHILCGSHPIEVLNFSAKHGYVALLDQAALATLSKSIRDVVNGLTVPGLAVEWMLYNQHWWDVHKLVASHVGHCPRLDQVLAAYFESAILDARNTQLKAINNNIICSKNTSISCQCISKHTNLQRSIDAMVAKVPKFSEIRATSLANSV